TLALAEGLRELRLVELVGRQREREPVAVAERARRLVAEPRELAHVAGDLGAGRLGRLPRLAPLAQVVAPSKDPLDLGVPHLGAADDPTVAREAEIDGGLELDDSRAEGVGHLTTQHDVAEEVE